jgi:hypothetical protein
MSSRILIARKSAVAERLTSWVMMAKPLEERAGQETGVNIPFAFGPFELPPSTSLAPSPNLPPRAPQTCLTPPALSQLRPSPLPGPRAIATTGLPVALNDVDPVWAVFTNVGCRVGG